MAGAMLRRPDLWTTALRSGGGLVPRRWWRRSPFLPLPDQRWLHFRLVTAYGGDGRFDGDTTPMRAGDLIVWLEWRKRFPV